MAQHDYIIANQSGAAFRSDLNNGLAAIVSQNSGAAQPSTTYAYQWWADTTTGLLKLRNAANNAWITVGTLASANLGLIPAGAASIVNADVNASAGIVASKLSFTQAGSGAAARTIDSKLNELVSVKDFGAVGDGVADDTAAIQAAIDSGKAAYVPKGTYKISATLNLNNGYKALIGDPSMPTIAKTNAGPAIRIGTTAGAVLNEYSRVENFYLTSLTVAPTFSSSPGPSDAGVVLDGSSSSLQSAVQNARVINVRVGNWSNGFYTNDVVACRIEGCFVQLLVDYTSASGFTASNKFCGFVLDGTPFTPGGFSPQASIELVDNDVGGSGTPSAVTSKGFYLIGNDLRDVFFDRCETATTSYGWYISTATADFNWDVQIRRPIVDAFKIHGIYIENVNGPGSITIDGGYFVGTGASAGACIYATGSNGITVTGGTQILGLANDSSIDDGIRFDSCNSCSIVGNNFLNLNYGVTLLGSKNCTVVGNHFFASATDTEPNPTLIDAIRLGSAAEENTIVGNVIKGKDATDVYSTGILIPSGCPRNVVIGNAIDSTTVTTLYSIGDNTTTLLNQDTLQAAALNIISAAGRLNIQGNEASYPIVFKDGAGNAISKINNSGVYSTGAP
jgi:parallel beta-helix repeat protein